MNFEIKSVEFEAKPMKLKTNWSAFSEEALRKLNTEYWPIQEPFTIDEMLIQYAGQEIKNAIDKEAIDKVAKLFNYEEKQ